MWELFWQKDVKQVTRHLSMLAEEKPVISNTTLDDNGWDESFSSYFLDKNCLIIEIFNHFSWCTIQNKPWGNYLKVQL